MNRIFIAILMAFFVTSCGGDKQEQVDSASKQSKPIQMIPDDGENALDELVDAMVAGRSKRRCTRAPPSSEAASGGVAPAKASVG